MVCPYAENRSFHAFQHYRRALGDSHHSPMRLKSARGIPDESGLLIFGNSLPGQDTEECHELTTIADSQREGVFPIEEVMKHFMELRVESNDTRPTFGGIQNICIGEPANKSNSPKSVESNSGGVAPGSKVSRYLTPERLRYCACSMASTGFICSCSRRSLVASHQER